VDTLIGDIVPPEALMKTLTDRKLAEQEKVTYDTQRAALSCATSRFRTYADSAGTTGTSRPVDRRFRRDASHGS